MPIVGKFAWLGPGAVLVALALSFIDLPLGPLAQELAYCGVLLTAATLLSDTGRHRGLRPTTFLILTTASLVGYILRFFSGYGRLNLATLAIALIMIYSLSRPSRHNKVRVLAAVMPFLLLSGAIGATRTTYSVSDDQRSTYRLDATSDILSDGSGLESVMSPLARSAELLRLDRTGNSATDQIGRGNGGTFLVALIPWVPRTWWPDKPSGFGRELAILLTPYDDLHSEAALTAGEWFYNFGYLGFFLMVPLHGFALSRLDRLLLGVTPTRGRHLNVGLKSLIAIVLAAGLADYVWMGAFTYMSRAGIRGAILACLLLVLTHSRSRVLTRKTRPFPLRE
jgi:hypothetical protein